MQHSRWKRFLEKKCKPFSRAGGRMFWEALKSVRHGTKQKLDEDGYPKSRLVRWTFKAGGSIDCDGGVIIFRLNTA